MTPQLETHIDGTAVRWFALVSHYEGMRAEVYQYLSNQLVEPLYLTTTLDTLLDRSPLIVALNERDPLSSRLRKENTLYFSAPSEVSFDTALMILRNRMKVQFGGSRKGLFHYYVPAVASYFFSRSDREDTAAWLGYFNSVYFYRQTLSDNPGWIYQRSSNSASDIDDWVLTESQERALNDKFHEQAIHRWSEDHQISSVNWQKQKSVRSFCTQHQIDEQPLLSRLRHLVHLYDVSLYDLGFLPEKIQSPHAIVENIEQFISREHHHVV